jgi:hypothetical protein
LSPPQLADAAHNRFTEHAVMGFTKLIALGNVVDKDGVRHECLFVEARHCDIEKL